MYNSCHFEFFDGHWWIMYPDGTKAWDNGYKTEWGAKRALEWLRSPI